MAEPICCGTPMVHNSNTSQWECADAYFALHDDGIDPYFDDPNDLGEAQRAYLEHWAASRIDDESVAGVSRRDPGAATGGIPTEPGRCACGEIESVHTVKADGSRGSCSRSGCPCKRYEEA